MLGSQDFSLIKQISHIQNQFLSFKYLAVFPSEYFFKKSEVKSQTRTDFIK